MSLPVALALLAGAVALAKDSPPDPDAPDAPFVKISNGLVTAVLYTPDPDKGYYRATRFDWSGQVADLQAGGHSYFGRWFAKYDPKKHDAIMGPVQEFVTGQGLDAAKAGQPFVKIGVGVLRKPDAPIRGFPTLEIIDSGQWTTHVAKDAVEFIHVVNDPVSGYGYRFVKRVSLPPGKSQLVLDERLESTGEKPIDTDVYNHNFFILDKQPTGPDIEVGAPFLMKAVGSLGDLAAITGNHLNYLRTYTPTDRPVHSLLTGFGATPKDYDIIVSNHHTGATVEVSADQPLAKLDFWSPATTTCPEAYIHVHADRGAPMTWRIIYSFSSIKPST